MYLIRTGVCSFLQTDDFEREIPIFRSLNELATVLDSVYKRSIVTRDRSSRRRNSRSHGEVEVFQLK